MPDPVRPAGRRLAAFAAVGLAVAVATCRDHPAGPAGGGRGMVNIAPVFAAGFEPADFGITVDSIRAIVIRPAADTLLDRRVPFPADSASIELDLTVVLLAPVETLTVALEYRGGGVALFRGSQSVEVRTGASGGTPPQPIPVSYVGPGALVDSLIVTPDDSVITWGDSLRFRVAAFQAGAPVTQFYVSWSSSDGVNAPVNGFGVLVAPGRRDSVYVTATTPSGARDSTRVAFRPVPTTIARASGDGQSALLGSALPQPLRVRVTAADGIAVQQAAVRFRAGMGGGSVADTLVYTDGSGFAQTVATLGLMVGAQTFEATLTPSQFVTFSATALANTPTRLEFTVEPGTTLAGSAITPAVQVTARDAGGGVSTGFSGPITVGLLANPGGGALAGTTTENAVGGVATFANLSLDRAAAGYTLLATAPGLTPDTSTAFTVTPRPATELVFSVQPTTATAGAALAPAVVVTARDAFGNTATGFTGGVTVAIATNPAGGALSGTATIAAVAGVATFSDLAIDRVGAGYTLGASAAGLSGASSAAFDITPGPAAQLAFTVEPSATTAGAPITPAIVVTARDAQGNTATGFTGSVTLAIGTSPGGGTLSGTATQNAAAGVATFPGLSIDRTGVGYTLTAASAGLTGATSAAFDITPGPATRLAFTVAPATTVAGVAIAPAVEVTAQDALGNAATAFAGTVTVALGANPGGATLSGTAASAAVAGVASFGDLSLDRAGIGYTLTASAPGLSGATSATFDITPAAASQLVFAVQPTTATAGVAIAPAPVVEARDGFGNLATAFVGTVTVAIGTNPGSGTLSGTLTLAAAGGVASFGDLSIDRVGTGYTLTAAATGLTGATSGAFNIAPAAAAQLAFSVEPVTTVAGVAITPAMLVAALDQFGNAATSYSGSITLAIGANPGGGTLSGPATQAAAGGVATFAGLSINRSGVGYTLTASATGLTGTTSAAFAITPGAASQLVFTVPPATTTAGQAFSPAVEVTARDAQGNTAAGFTGTVTIAIGANPGGGTLAGTTGQAAVAGVATFPGLSIDRSGVGYTLAASASGLTGATSAAFGIVPGPAAQLVFTVQPANATAGTPITPAVVVTARDALGNTATGFTGGVSIAIGTNPSGGALSGTTTVAAAAGVASFADLAIDLVGTGYTLTASASGLTGATSAPFDIIASTATQLVFTVGPTTTVAGAPITPAIEVTAQDAFGNTATGFTAGVTIVIGTNPGSGTLSGTTTRAAVAGVATFPGLSINRTGTGYTLSATSGGLPPASSAGFDIVPGPATQLVFTQQPVNTVAGVAITPAVVVHAVDDFGNLDTAFAASVSLAIGTNPAGGFLSGTTTVNPSGGVASFADLSIDRAGSGYTLSAAAATIQTGVTSAAFDITPGAATQLVFTVEPTNVAAGAAIAPAVVAAVQDAFGNTVPSFVDSVFMAFATNATGDGILSGTRRLVAVAGVATFGDLSVDLAGSGYTLEASAPGLTPDTSAAFDVAPGPISPATSIVTVSDSVVAVGNTLTFTLQAYDQFSNQITVGGDTVVFTAAGGTSDGTISSASDLGNGTYLATYTATTAGTEDTIGATVNAQPVTSTPLPTVRVFAAQTVHSTDVVTNETWTAAQNPHVVTAYLRVRNGATLTIEQGAEVRFDAGTGLQVGDTSLAETGGLVMQGGPGTIRLTANTASPTPGFWRGVEVQNGLAVPAWKNVVIEYAGGARPPQTPSTEACVLVVNDQGQPFVMDSVKIRQCVHAGIHLFGGNLQVRRSSIDSVTGSGIHVDFRGRLAMDSTRIVGSGQEGLLVASPIAGLTTNEFNKFLGNALASVRIQAPQLRGFKQQDSIAGNGFLPGGFGDSVVVDGGLVDGGGTQFRLFAQAAPYLVLGHLKMVNAPIILMPGLVMAFDQGAGFQFGDSTAGNDAQITSQGTAANRVLLTNRAGTPGWRGLYLGRQSGATTLAHVHVQNGGYLPAAPTQAANVIVDAAGGFGPVNIDGMRSIDSRNHGIAIVSRPANGFTVRNDTIVGSAGVGLVVVPFAAPLDSIVRNVITPGNQYPLGVSVTALPGLDPLTANSNIVSGNQRDTLLLDGGTLATATTVPDIAGLPWRVLDDIFIDGGALSIAANTLTFDDSVEVQVGGLQPGGLRAVGTPAQPKLFTVTPGHPSWWGILYRNVAPGGAAPFTTLEHVIVERAGHFEPCFGDCGPIPFGALRFYNQSTESVTFDSIVVREAVAYALDVQPVNASKLTVSWSQFYANPFDPMIRGPEAPGNGQLLVISNSDLYRYGGVPVSSVYQGGLADSVVAINNWWGDVDGATPQFAFQDSLGRASFGGYAVRFVPFATTPHFPVGAAAEIRSTTDTSLIVFPRHTIGATIGNPDSIRVRTLDARGRGVGGVSVTWAVDQPSGSLSATSNSGDVGGRTPGIVWISGTESGAWAVTASAAGLLGSPVVFTDIIAAGPTVSVNWQLLQSLTPGGVVAPDSNSVSYTSSNKPSALRTNARDTFGNVTTPTSWKFTTGTCPLGQPDGTLGQVDSIVGELVYFRPLGLGNYKLCAFYDGGLVQDSALISVATNVAGIRIDRDIFQPFVQDTGRHVFNALCPVGGPCGFYSQRDFTVYVVDSGGAPIGNDNSRFEWSLSSPPDTNVTIDAILNGPIDDGVRISAHAAGTRWLIVTDTAAGSPLPGARDSMLVLADQIGQYILFTPDSDSLLIGQSATFTARVHDLEGAPLPNQVVHFREDLFAPGRLTITDTSVANQVTVRLDSTPYGYAWVEAFWPRPLKDTLYGYFPGDTVLGFGYVVNPVQRAIDVGGNPFSAGVNPVTNRVYVSSGFGTSVAVIDGATDQLLTTVDVGALTGLVAVNPKTNRIYVTENSGSQVFGIDGTSNTVLDTIAAGTFPFGIAVDTARNRLYVASQHCVVFGQVCSIQDFLTVLDASTRTLVDTVFLGDQGIGVGYNPVTSRIYVAMFAGPVDTVKVIDAVTLTVVDSIQVGSGAYGVAVNPVTNTIYVSNESDGTISVIDGATNTVTGTIFVGFSVFPEGIGIDPVRNLVYVGLAGTSVISVIDGSTNTLVGQIDVGNISTDAQPNPVTNRVYVPVYGSGQVRVLRFQ